MQEMRVRGYHPFQPPNPLVTAQSPFQDWVLADGVVDKVSGSFIHSPAPTSNANPIGEGNNQTQSSPSTIDAGRSSSDTRAIALNADVIDGILAATHAMPSWKACQMEGTSWTGTAEENVKKYFSAIGVQDS